MVIDVIILSYAKNNSIIEMNNNCINSLSSSSDQHQFNIILIETDSTKEHSYPQKNVRVIQPKIEFNYNKFLNIGLKECKNDWILISNNDTVYHKNFLENMFIANQFDTEILSMSPMDDTWHRHKDFNRSINIYYGYRVSYEITGWSILVNRKVFDIIGEFDEEFTFWYQDNDYAKNLEKHNIKHALITESKVTHLLSKSHDLIDNDKKHEMTNGLGAKFINKWSK